MIQRKFSALFLLICLVAALLYGCAEKEYTFAFSVELRDPDTREVITEVARGDRIEVAVTVTNASGRAYEYVGAASGFNADVILSMTEQSYEYRLVHEPIAETADKNPHRIEDGESSTRSYYFTIPEDAPSGEYVLYTGYQHSSERQVLFCLTEEEVESSVEVEEYTFTFGVELRDPDTREVITEVERGDRIEVAVTVTNDSGETYRYMGLKSQFSAYTKLYTVTGEGEYVLIYEPIPTDTLIEVEGWQTVETSDSHTDTYYYSIPADAPSGEYRIFTSYKGSSEEQVLFRLTDAESE